MAVPMIRPSAPRRLKPLNEMTVTQPTISTWRLDPIKMRVEFRANDKLYLFRYHPHKDCTGRFMLLPDQVRTLLDGCRAGKDVICLPQSGKTRCEAWRLPDKGLQLIRFDKNGQRVETFRILSADLQVFLTFCQFDLLPLF